MLIQLAGVPGSGKSTLARGLARARGLVVLDKDVVASALLDAGIGFPDVGRLSYQSILALADDLLAQGHAVVIDSPCRYPDLLRQGQTVAAARDVAYVMVELRVADVRSLLPRLDRREHRPSQVTSAVDPVAGTRWELGTPEATLAGWQAQGVRPARGLLQVDADLPSCDVLDSALAFLDAVGARRR